LTYARALVIWRGRHRHCGVCGAPTVPRNAGHVLVCTNSACQSEFFPRIDPARYFAAQPWPFPASLMLGFHAHASAGMVQLDGELEDARWFELEELRA